MGEGTGSRILTLVTHDRKFPPPSPRRPRGAALAGVGVRREDEGVGLGAGKLVRSARRGGISPHVPPLPCHTRESPVLLAHVCVGHVYAEQRVSPLVRSPLAGVLVVYGVLLTRRARWYVAAVYVGLVSALAFSALWFSHACRGSGSGMLSGSSCTRADRSPFLSSVLYVEAPGLIWGPGVALARRRHCAAQLRASARGPRASRAPCLTSQAVSWIYSRVTAGNGGLLLTSWCSRGCMRRWPSPMGRGRRTAARRAARPSTQHPIRVRQQPRLREAASMVGQADPIGQRCCRG